LDGYVSQFSSFGEAMSWGGQRAGFRLTFLPLDNGAHLTLRNLEQQREEGDDLVTEGEKASDVAKNLPAKTPHGISLHGPYSDPPQNLTLPAFSLRRTQCRGDSWTPSKGDLEGQGLQPVA
jgi:hypothetical protein